MYIISSGGSCEGSDNVPREVWGGSGAVCWCVCGSAGVLPAPGDLRGGGGQEQAERWASECLGTHGPTLDVLQQCYIPSCPEMHVWYYQTPEEGGRNYVVVTIV